MQKPELISVSQSAIEFDESLIKKIQMGFRKEAGVSSYNPDEPSILGLPTLDQVISGFDPTPPYLRCTECHGRLLRGLQSTFCIYCGTQQRRDVPSITISFKSTVGYQMLLESLELDGSEAISLITEPNESSKGQSASEGLVLSDLLDLEISWPLDLKETENSSTNKLPTQTMSSLNLSGVDLDNFFSEAKADASSFTVSEEQLFPPKQITSTDNHVYSGQESSDLFKNIQSSDMAVSSVDIEGEFGDSFSGWAAEFKSSNTEALHVDAKSFDPFLGSSTINLSSSVDAPSTIDLGIDTDFTFISKGNDGKFRNDPGHLSATSDNWGQDDLWHDTSAELPNKTDQLNRISKADDGVPKTGPNQLSSNTDDWMQDDLWQSSNPKISKNTADIMGNDDSSDAWQDFTGSGDALDPFSSSWEQTGNERAEMYSADLNGKFQEMEFGRFLQTNLVSGVSNIQAGLTDVSNVQIEDSLSDGKEGTELKTVMEAQSQIAASKGANFSATMQFESSDSIVDRLISKIPDLSFMLESNLSIPKNDESTDIIL